MPIEHAWHNNLFRAFCRPLLSQSASTSTSGDASSSSEVPQESGKVRRRALFLRFNSFLSSNVIFSPPSYNIPSSHLLTQPSPFFPFKLKLKLKAFQQTPEPKLVPYTALSSFAQAYEEPSMEEGFSEIRTVRFVFEGTEEEERFYRMWLQIDGK